jgi:tetratricopeptide (TPR) repeat protein
MEEGDVTTARPAVPVLVVEAVPGRERTRLLERRASQIGSEGRWVLSCHFDHGGPWAGIKQLFASFADELRRRRPDLIHRHDYELVHVLPELRQHIQVRNPTLTDTAPYEEKTRNYPADRAFRMIHGLIDLLDAWRREIQAGPWVLALDHFDRASHIGGHFFREMLRRRAQPWGLHFLAAVEPGQAGKALERLGVETADEVMRFDLTGDPPISVDPKEARQQALALEEHVGENEIQIQIHLPDLIRLWEQAGNRGKAFRWRCWGLEIYNTLGLYEDALVYGDGALDLAEGYDPDNVEVQWSIFVKLFMSLAGLGRTREAGELAMRVFDRIDNLRHKGQLCYLIAMLYGRFYEERDFARAEEYLDRGLEMLQAADLSDAELHFQTVFNRNGLAMIRTFQGRLNEALELCKEGLQRLDAHLTPDKHRLHRSVLHFNMAQVYARIGAMDEAHAQYSAAMEMDPNYSEYYNDRGSLLLQAGRYEKAYADYHKALELSPPYHEIYANLGQCCRMMGQLEEAVDAYSRSLDLRPFQAVSLLGRAQAYEALGRLSDALADYSALVRLDPDHWQGRAGRAVLLYEMKDLEASLADLNRAIQVAPKVPDLYHNRAILQVEMGRPQDARNDFIQYLRLQPDGEDRPEVEARLAALEQATIAASP